MANKVVFSYLDKRSEKFSEIIESSVKKILKILKKDSVGFEIYFISGAKMKSLNKRFRGKDKSTNILSFPEKDFFPNPEFKKIKYIGEIYIDISLTKEWQDFKKQPSQKFISLNHLLIHGTLHLLGHTHSKKKDREKMEKIENIVLTSI